MISEDAFDRRLDLAKRDVGRGFSDLARLLRAQRQEIAFLRDEVERARARERQAQRWAWDRDAYWQPIIGGYKRRVLALHQAIPDHEILLREHFGSDAPPPLEELLQSETTPQPTFRKPEDEEA